MQVGGKSGTRHRQGCVELIGEGGLTDDEWFAVKNGQVITQWPADDNYLQLTYQDEVKAVYAYNQNTGEWRSRYVFNNK